MSEVREKSVGYRVQPGYKQTEVGLIPEEWFVTRLDEIGSVEMGHSPPGESYNHDGFGICLINGPTEFTAKFPRRIQWTTAPTRTCRPGDLLICVRGSSTGRTNYADDTYCIGRGVAAIRSKATNSNSYVAMHVIAAVEMILAATTGSTFPSIDGNSLRGIRLPIPPTLAEQTAIAEALGDADAWIESLEQMVAKKRHLKQAAMQQLLTGKKRLPGFEGKWQLKPLGDVLTVMHGKSQKGVEVSDGNYPILASGGQIGSTNRFLHDQPSVLIGRKGTIDRPQYVDTPFWTVDTLFYSVVHNANNARFLYYRFCMIDWRSHNEASGVPSLNSGTIESIEIRIPASAEQTAIAEVLADMDADIKATELKLVKARQIKQGMMQELLTGRIRLV